MLAHVPDAEPGRIRSAYIVGAGYDWAFFLLPPLAALALGIGLSGTRVADETWMWSDQEVTTTTLLLGVFIHAHLIAVFFRSHGNRAVLTQHPYRFWLVPAMVLTGMMISPLLAITCSVIGTFWDVYHSGAQTFGFSRIYDAKVGNDPHEGRRLDFLLNQVIYAGPILAGATMLDHFEDFTEYEAVGELFFSRIPVYMEGHQAIYAKWVIAGAVFFIAYYVFVNVRMVMAGRRVSLQKVFLLATTAIVSVYTWGFNTWGEAFLIMNFFHALQYFGIVWASEKGSLRKLFRLEKLRGGLVIAWWAFVGLTFAYGIAVEAFADGRSRLWWSVTIVVSLMHFWYDGFIWSVRKAKT